MTHDCGPGTLSASTSSTFTCVFPDVPKTTLTSVGVHASIAGRTIATGQSVNILPRPPVISGATSVIAGRSATYTYAPLPFPENLDIPDCSGQITAFSPGSITCTFADSQAAYTGGVAITRMFTPSSPFDVKTATLSVDVVPDLDHRHALTAAQATTILTRAGAIKATLGCPAGHR